MYGRFGGIIPNSRFQMKITFLGTGTSQGVPVIACNCGVCTSLDKKDKRLRTSILIEIDNRNFVVDTGPDFRQQMLREKVDQLDAVLFTHEHKDHIAGMDDIRAFNFISSGKEMEIYATSAVQSALKREFHYVFDEEDKYPGVPMVHLNTIDKNPFSIQGIEIVPIEVSHFRMKVLGYRVQDFTYITDANSISAEEMKKIEGTKILVLNALRKSPHISHFSLEEALELIKQINPERAYLTHISHLLGTHAEVSKELPENVFLAYDGLSINL